MLNKNKTIAALVLSLLLVPSFYVHAVVYQTEVLTREQKILLIQQLLTQVKSLQAQLEALVKTELVGTKPINITISIKNEPTYEFADDST